jgi:hypothetical protein
LELREIFSKKGGRNYTKPFLRKLMCVCVGGGGITSTAKLHVKHYGRSIDTYFGCMVESLPTNASKSRASS